MSRLCMDADKLRETGNSFTSRSRDSEDGAVIVEGAIAGFIFLALLLAVIEFSVTFFDYMTTTNATRNSARTGATVGNDPLADYKILQKVSSSAATMPMAEIQKIVIFKASVSSTTVPSSCLTGAVTNVCNVYTSSDLSRDASDFACSNSSPDRYWCPTSRLVGASANGTPVTGPPDYLGVYIQAVHPTVTKLFTSDYSFSNSFVLRLEAQTP